MASGEPKPSSIAWAKRAKSTSGDQSQHRRWPDPSKGEPELFQEGHHTNISNEVNH